MTRLNLWVGAILVFVWIGAEEALAQSPPMFKPASGGTWVGMQIGPSIKLSKLLTQFEMTQTFGYHLNKTPIGPAVAIDMQETFGNDAFGFYLVPRFVWDFQPIPGMGLYIGPTAGFGFALLEGNAGFTLQLAVDGRLTIAQKFFVSLRPFGLEITGVDFETPFGNSFEVGVRWDFLFGGGMFF